MNRSGAFAQSPSIDIANLDVKRHGSLYLSAGNSTVPVWVKDSESDACMVCTKKFSIVKGRHHCRSCGFLVCGTCSSARLQLPHTAGRVRCCDRCVKDLQTKPASLPATPGVANATPLGLTVAPQPTSPSTPSLSNPSGVSSVNSSSTQTSSTATAGNNQSKSIQQWKQQIEKESEMVKILEGQSNGYSSLVDLYQSPDLLSAPLPYGEVIPNDFTGVGADCPDWAYIFSSESQSKAQARIGRIRLKINDVENLIMNNINLQPHSDPNGTPFKVENATLSAFVALGNTFHQTAPVPIGVTSSHDEQTKEIRSAKGAAKVNQGCVLDLGSVAQSLRLQIVLNRITPPRTIDGHTLPEQTLAIPIGYLNIPISSLQPNTLQSLSLSLTPTTPQQISALTQTPAYLRKPNAALSSSKQAQKATIKIDIECTVSSYGLLWSNFATSQLYNDATTPPLSVYNIIHYSLLVLNTLRPTLTALLSIVQLFTWHSPLISFLFLIVFGFEVFYPIPMALIILHLFIVRLLLSPLLNKSSETTNEDKDTKPAPKLVKKSDQDLFPSTEITPQTLHQLAQLSPDSDSASSSRSTEGDGIFVTLLLEFFEKLLGTFAPPNASLGPASAQIFSFESLTSFYQSIHSIYTLILTPYLNLITWQVSPLLPILVTLITFFSLFLVPSHLVYIVLGLLPFLYNSAPVRWALLFLKR